MKKRILIAAAVCILLISMLAGALAGVMDTVRTLLAQEEPSAWNLEAGMNLQAYPPFGDKRTEQFNDLIRHIRMQIQKTDGGTADVKILVDENEAYAIRLNAFAQDSSDEKVQQALRVFDLLDDGADFLRDLPGKIPEACSEKKIRQKLKKGTAVQSVTINIIPGEEGPHPLSELIQKADSPALKALLGTWTFTGKHKFTLLYDEEGRLLKANYTGRAGEAENRIRNIRLEWRIYRSGENVWDELTLRTPTVEGADRDNWVINRNQTTDEAGEALTYSFEYDQKTGNDKIRCKWEGDLTGKEGLAGEVSYSRTIRNETDQMIFRPDLLLCSPKQINGALEIIHVSDKIEKEHFTLLMNWNAVSEVDQNIPDDSGSECSSPEAAFSPEAAAAVLRNILLHVPEKDLGYLKDEIPDSDWNLILEEAGRSADHSDQTGGQE